MKPISDILLSTLRVRNLRRTLCAHPAHPFTPTSAFVLHASHLLPLIFGLLAAVCLLSSCNPERFLAEDEYILHSNKLVSTDKHVSTSAYEAYIRQNPNARWFNLLKVPLGLYCLSPADTSRHKGRFFRKIGEAPVVYDPDMADYTTKALQSALRAKGYVHAVVTADTTQKKRNVNVTYRMTPGRRYYVNELAYYCDDENLKREIDDIASASLLYKGMPLDVSRLSEERNRIISALQDRGYYRLNNEFVSYRVDTLLDDTGVELTQVFSCPAGVNKADAYRKYYIGEINVYEDAQPTDSNLNVTHITFHNGKRQEVDSLYNIRQTAGDTLLATRRPHLLNFYYPDKLHIRKGVYLNHIILRPDSLFSESDVQNTYSGLNALQAVKYSMLRMRSVPGDSARLDADLTINRTKPHSISTELEGTNTNGNLGAALALTYANRNTFRGAEVLSLKLRGAYEAITGLEGYNDENYFEYSIEGSLRFPTFHLPFSSLEGRQQMRAVSNLGLIYDSQDRPEFHRRVLTGNWNYQWNHVRHPGIQHLFNVLSLNYVFMPWISDTFKKDYLEGEDSRYSILRSSYEDLFIMSSAYSFTYNSQQEHESLNTPFRQVGMNQLTKGWQIKARIEIAGNLLYAFSALTHTKKNADGQYKLFNIAFSQYVKTEIDFTRMLRIDERNTFALHSFFGIAIPYANASTIPYEKRFFSGGANSVRGWGVRQLGPGSYTGKDGKVDFINQTGNIKLDLSAEWRTHLFWKFDGALFVDAGNIWNTRAYPGQENGKFKFDKFYKQIAVAYGLGIRFNLDYFVLRFDGGMKAINPAVEKGKGHYPIIHPNFSRDFAFHFAVGLPF